MSGADYERFANLGFDDFRTLARDESLSPYERIGFPDSYREGFEADIFADLRAKLPALDERGRRVVDIGPGCSDLPKMLRSHCEEHDHELFLVDSPEMLDHHAEGPAVHKVPGRFPEDVTLLLDSQHEAIDVVIAYSVLHYVYPEQSVHGFLDAALSLLAHGGALLVGDIPNWSMRSRFMASPPGVEFHRHYTHDESLPEVPLGAPHPGRMGDGVVLGLVAHARESGFHAWVVPQPAALPMANRREDLLVVRP